MVDVKSEIMDQSRHLFVYGYNNDSRKEIVDSLEKDYPVVFDSNKPMAVNIKDLGIPDYKINYDGVDYNKLILIGKEYFDFTVFDSIIKRTREAYDDDFINQRLKNVYEMLNRSSLNPDPIVIEDIKSLLSVIEEAKDFYHGTYKEYVETGRDYKPIDVITLPFVDLDFLIKRYKSEMNNNSYFGFIIDKQNPIARTSMMAINLYTGARINDNISMKIFTDPNDWDCYKTSDGGFVEAVHDYGEVELDDSVKKYIKEQKRRMGIQID